MAAYGKARQQKGELHFGMINYVHVPVAFVVLLLLVGRFRAGDKAARSASRAAVGICAYRTAWQCHHLRCLFQSACALSVAPDLGSRFGARIIDGG